MPKILLLLSFLAAALMPACGGDPHQSGHDAATDAQATTADANAPESLRTRTVTATAYTSHETTKDDEPVLAAWGDTLKPDANAIAVSRDLIGVGLDHGQEVSIEGLPGRYVVLDKMNKRWTNKIDIYMGDDLERARQWGKREVEIQWRPQLADQTLASE